MCFASLNGVTNWITIHFLIAAQKDTAIRKPQGSGNRPISDVHIPRNGAIVHLKDYGFVKIFKVVSPNDDIEYRVTDDLMMDVEQCANCALQAWRIKNYHRGVKQFCGIERAQPRSGLNAITAITLVWLSEPSSA